MPRYFATVVVTPSLVRQSHRFGWAVNAVTRFAWLLPMIPDGGTPRQHLALVEALIELARSVGPLGTRGMVAHGRETGHRDIVASAGVACDARAMLSLMLFALRSSRSRAQPRPVGCPTD